MQHRLLALGRAIIVFSVGVFLMRMPGAAQTGTAAVTSLGAQAKNWKPARTPWGHPDLSGVYSNSDENGIAFEKPDEFVGRRLDDITRAELRGLTANDKLPRWVEQRTTRHGPSIDWHSGRS